MQLAHANSRSEEVPEGRPAPGLDAPGFAAPGGQIDVSHARHLISAALLELIGSLPPAEAPTTAPPATAPPATAPSPSKLATFATSIGAAGLPPSWPLR